MKKSGIIKLAVLCAAGLLLCAFPGTALAEAEARADSFSYEDMADLQFWFSSGVGAWGTWLVIHADGTFEGNYHDSDMGDMGEGYPNGTVYVCDFSGQFGELEQRNDYTYAASVETLEVEREAGGSEITDGIRYIYSEPYGLNEAEEVLFYAEGAPLDELPEAYRSWVGYYDLSAVSETALPFTGLYNEATEAGFSSYVREESGTLPDTPEGEGQSSAGSSWEEIQTLPEGAQNSSGGTGESIQVFPDIQQAAIDTELETLAEKAAELEAQINDGALSQSELNQISYELYTLWDDELNSMWKRIREILSEEEMSALTDEELAWIEEKEASAAAAGAEFEGGSMQPFMENTTAARLTRERVYELADYLR